MLSHRLEGFFIRSIVKFYLCLGKKAKPACLSGQSCQIEERGEDVHNGDRLGDSHAGRQASRRTEKKGDADGRFVDEQAMERFPVLTKAFAMVPDNGQDRALGVGHIRELRKQLADSRVHEGDLAVVRVAGVALRERRWRIVRRVRVEVVDPEEEPLALLPRQPGKSRGVDLRRIPFFPRVTRGPAAGPFTRGPESLIINVKPLAEAEDRGKGKGRDEGGRLVASRPEDLREGPFGSGQDKAAVVAHAMGGRIAPRHDRAVGRERDRRGGARFQEEDALASDGSESRRFDRRVAVATYPVGAGGVQRQEDDGPSFGRHSATGRDRSQRG